MMAQDSILSPGDSAADPDSSGTAGAQKSISLVTPSVAALDGLVEVLGFLEAAEARVFAGWVMKHRVPDDTWMVSVVSEAGTLSGSAHVGFYDRADLPPGGVGFACVVAATPARPGRLQALEVVAEAARIVLRPAIHARELRGPELSQRAEALGALCRESATLAELRDLTGRRFIGEGFVDACGAHPPSAGWFMCGWVSNDWIGHARAPGVTIAATAIFDSGPAGGESVVTFHSRDDLAGRGLGFVLHAAAAGSNLGPLRGVRLRAGHAVLVARPAAGMAILPPDKISVSFTDLIGRAEPGPPRARLADLVARAAFEGHDTIDKLPDRIFIGLDEVILCPGDSVVLAGWMLARPGSIRAIRLRTTSTAASLDMVRGLVWIDRPDVIEAIGRANGFADPRCGFLARVPAPRETAGPFYLEIEDAAGRIAYKTLPREKLEGMDAIRRLLDGIASEYADIDTLFDHVVGPPVAALNGQRLRHRPALTTLTLGTPPAAPRFSLIVPLYGRIDFLEMQMALFATIGLEAGTEIIYVLDDPPKAREAQYLADSVYARFRLPFTLLCLSRNMGFAPANNIGLDAASGAYVCLLNSDVMPTTATWLDMLALDLEMDPGLGVVGPLLLFEDGSVQHQGMYFKRLAQYADWWFPHHTRKGFRPPAARGLVRQHTITGAAMLLRRADLLRCGGLDEAFVIGDFEDTDLCFKLAREGLGAAVDLDVAMVHLERKSQAQSANRWRSNLTLYNAWVQQRRWGETIARLAQSP